jgi:hypothetical protein
MRVERRKQMIAVVADQLLHRHVDVLASAGRLGATGFVDNGELKAIAEVGEALAIPVQVEIDAALLVVIVWLRRGIGVGEADAARIALNHLGIVARISASAAIGGRPMRLLELGGVLSGQPPMAIGGHRRLQEEVVAEGKTQRQFVVIRAGSGAKRKTRFPIDGDTTARARDVAEEQIVRGIFLVDEDDVFDLSAGFPGLARDGIVGILRQPAIDEAVVGIHALRVCVQLLLRRNRDDVHRSQDREFG